MRLPRGLVVVHEVGDAAAGRLHVERDLRGGVGFGKLEGRGAERDLRRPRRRRERREHVRFEAQHGHGSERRHRGVAAPRPHLGTPPLDLHRDATERTVERGVRRRVGEEIVEATVGIDALERGHEVVGVVDEEAARLLRQHPEARLGVLLEHELGPLDVAGPRLARVVVGHLGRVVVAHAADGDEAARRGRLLALHPQALGVDSIDADIGPVGGLDHGVELRGHGRGHRQALREQHHRLAPGQGAEAPGQRRQCRGLRVPVAVAHHLLEELLHPFGGFANEIAATVLPRLEARLAEWPAGRFGAGGGGDVGV